MVYLCWERAYPMAENRPSTLFAVYGSEVEAREVCEQRALTLACGSGLITQAMTGDSWDVTDKKRRTFTVGIETAEFGPLERF